MQLDIYRRSEPDQKLSYLAVPAGRRIPPEAVSTEWVLEVRALERDETLPAFDDYGIHEPGRQLREKGYAITALANQLQDSG